MEVQEPVCPESTIESAVQRNPPPRKVVPSLSIINDNKESKLACESTIDSSLRRDFIKKAALFGAAAAVGTTLLGSKIIPESSASSCTKSSSVHPDSNVSYCCPTGTAIKGNTCSGIGVEGVAVGYGHCCGIGVKGVATGYGTAVEGVATGCGSGVVGVAGFYPGVYGTSSTRGVQGYSGSGAGVMGCSCSGTGVVGYSPLGKGVQGYSCVVGVKGNTCSGIGVEGNAGSGTGVYGSSSSGYGIGVRGVANGSCGTGVWGGAKNQAGVYGISCAKGVMGYSTSPSGIGVFGCSAGIALKGVAASKNAIPLVAKGASCQCSPLTEWQNSSGTPLSVVNKNGWLGIGTCSPATTLQVNGSIGAKVATPSCSTYSVGNNCFAVLVNATSAAKTVNLPSAVKGMILYIKNTGTDFAVTIKPKSGDTIEGASSKLLPKKYGVQLIAGGNSPDATWYIISYIS